jgi:sigma-B regulation protein RsbU (phosphoserine phosphatase)
MGIVIADVEGKGVSAALFSNMLRSTVHFLTRETPSAAAVLSKLNAIFHKEGELRQKLFSMFYAVYDACDKIMTYSGWGHVRPVVISSKNGVCERLCSDGTLVGASTHLRSVERSIQLYEGDLVAFFTDGLIDHANGAGEHFGEQRLTQILTAHTNESLEEILQEIKQQLSAFSPLPGADDATILVIRIL